VGDAFGCSKGGEVLDYRILPEDVGKFFRVVFLNPEHGTTLQSSHVLLLTKDNDCQPN